MKMKHLLTIAVAAVLAFAAVNVNAQSIVMSGSSAIFLEVGQSSAVQPLSGSAIANCGWSDNSTVGKQFTLTDTRPGELGESDANLVDGGNQGWVTWTINGGTCAGTTAGTLINVNVMVSVDSGVGNRCFFANPSCSVSTTHSNAQSGAGLLNSATFTETTFLPQAVLNVFPLTINSAATDIRPEDSLFSTKRGFTGCGYPMATGSQYMGTGYQTEPSGYGPNAVGLVGTKILNGGQNGAGSGPFNLALWTLSGNDPFAAKAGLTKNAPSYTVYEVGAVPVVVIVNPSNESGLGSLQVTNIDSGVLSGYLDGSLQRVADLLPQSWNNSSPAEVFTFVREFLSGTYNTMDFNVPDTVTNQSDQDVGLAAVGGGLQPLECAGAPSSVQTTNSGGLLADSSSVFSGTYFRVRTIGTGSMVTAVEGKGNALGYAFWSAANFSSATGANLKYLTVDGVDPLQEVWQDGQLPTSGNGLLPVVSLSHVRDGSYPIWSIVRVICGTNCTALQALVNSAGNFVGPNQPDFVPLTGGGSLKLVRSHFVPPGLTLPCNSGSPSNGNTAAGETAECGGDVGGVVYTLQADGDYSEDSGNSAGEVAHRR
jgi:hypothetical protein